MDYQKIGLKCGIEIHQQLDTPKLFCNCPSEIIDNGHDLVFHRKLRAVIGETGHVDAAAAHETLRQKQFEYQFFEKSCCLIEMDEEPPRNMDKEALDIVLSVSKTLNADIVDEVQVMRKTVVDGSNTTGFQRTSLVSRNGHVDSSLGKVNIPTICLEEDSCKIVKEEKDKKIYNLSRLGIPLIELGTAPDIKTPEHAKEIAEYLGMILRSTRKVKRGLGTIRQDLNISIKGGARIEIKGAQDLRLIPKWAKIEAKRQLALLEIKKNLGKRPDNLRPDIIELKEELSACSSKVIKKTFEKKGTVMATILPGFDGLIRKEIAPGKRLGTELSDYAKVNAGVGGLFHSDELPAYGVTQEETDMIKTKLKCSPKDAFIMIADSPEKTKIGLDAAFQRAIFCYEGVPEEVRRPNQDGTTTFMRPIPGAARMYPETDVLPIKPDLKSIKKPKLLTEVAKDYEKILGKEIALQMSKSDKFTLYESLSQELSKLKPLFIAESLLNIPKELRRKHNLSLSDDEFNSTLTQVLKYVNKAMISKDAVMDLMVDYAKKKVLDISKYKLLTDKEIEKEIDKLIEKHRDLPFNALIGKVMASLKGRADGKKISELVRKRLA